MQTSARILVVLALICALASGASPLGARSLHHLTLEQALELAERHHPQLAEARARVEAAEGRARQAGTFPSPEAVARMESAPMTSRAAREAEYLGGIAQPVPLGRRLSRARDAEWLERERLLQELNLKQNELRRRVHSAFATALYQEQAFLLQREIVSHAEQGVETTKALLEAGDALPEELARMELELARAHVERRRAESMREQAMAALGAEIGDPQLELQSLEGSLDAAFQLPALRLLAREVASHPSLNLAEAEVRAGQARIDLAKAERIPDIRVELLYRRLEHHKQNAFDVGVSMPLPVFDRNQGRIHAARSELAAAEARSRQARNDLQLRLRHSYAQWNGALEQARMMKEEMLPRAAVILKSAEARYEQGDTSLAALLPIRRDWAAAQLDYLESLREVMQAWAELRAVSGGQ
jgi:outer membrane protein, heavy metal efflux system